MNTSGWNEIADFVLKHDYCCGCGVCAGVCPNSTLEMRFNKYGEYRPYLIGNCNNCGLCSNVCPFVDGNANEDELSRIYFSGIPNISHTVETGYYLDTYVGHVADPQVRWNSASGGMATWFLGKLVAEKDVDYVLCVSPNDDPHRLFKYTICVSTEDIRKCSRSCYYPVTVQEVLSFVAKNKGRYAIVGLPCVCKAVRLGQQKSRQFRERIAYVVGLVCGQTKSKGFAEYICALGGGDPQHLAKVEFRVKDMSRPASDFGLHFTCGESGGSSREGTIFCTQGMSRAWSDRYFTPNACNFCDDVFAECADVVFMDAWLPEYFKEPRGYNLVLTRNSRVNEIFEHEAEHPLETTIRRLNVESIIRSQMGVFCSKRGDMRDRMALMKKEGSALPVKRWNARALIRPLGMWRLNAAHYQMSRSSGFVWAEVDKDLDAFEFKMRNLRDKIDRTRRRHQSYRIINAILRKAGLLRQWASTHFYS